MKLRTSPSSDVIRLCASHGQQVGKNQKTICANGYSSGKVMETLEHWKSQKDPNLMGLFGIHSQSAYAPDCKEAHQMVLKEALLSPPLRESLF